VWWLWVGLLGVAYGKLMDEWEKKELARAERYERERLGFVVERPERAELPSPELPHVPDPEPPEPRTRKLELD
jgi:hypothetical protein